MNLTRIAVVMAAAFAFSTGASAATVCVQNKSNGQYEPKSPTKDSANDCALMNKAKAAALVAPVMPEIQQQAEDKQSARVNTKVESGLAPTADVARAPAAVAASIPAAHRVDISHEVAGDKRAVEPLVLPVVANAAVTQADPAQQARTYRLKLSDLTVRLALNRWLKEANMQLAYEAGEEFNAAVEGDYVGTMSEVLFKLMTSLKQTKYPLRACEYDNRVVLVVHRDDVCPLEDE